MSGRASSPACATRFVPASIEEGLSAAIDAVDALLARHFPLAPTQANPNELPDEPLLG